MLLEFTKMHGLGNDFVVIDDTTAGLELSRSQCQLIADRHFGVGCDQILLVSPARSPETDFYYRIYNADGSEVEQCGNGARCFARFVREKGLTDQDVIRVGTLGGEITLFLEPDGLVRVNMGVPRLEPEQIPFQAQSQAPLYDIQVGEETLELSALSMGNPHAVLLVEELERAPVERLGPLLEHHPRFPQRTNVGFMQLHSRDSIGLRVFERGTGETLACGSGACAAVVAGRMRGLLDAEVRVGLKGGELVIKWDGDGEPVWMSGPAALVYEGRIDL